MRKIYYGEEVMSVINKAISDNTRAIILDDGSFTDWAKIIQIEAMYKLADSIAAIVMEPEEKKEEE